MISKDDAKRILQEQGILRKNNMESTLTYKIGDATKPEALGTEAYLMIAHVANNIGVMGAGFVIPLKARFGGLFDQYRKYCKSDRTPEELLGTVDYYYSDDSDCIVANMIAQANIGRKQVRPLDYDALIECMQDVVRQIKHQGDSATIHCPKFGAGLAGGDWHIIEALIQAIWVDAGYNVVVYCLTPEEIPADLKGLSQQD